MAKAHRRELARDRRRLVERLTKEHLDAASAAEDTEESTATQERYLIALDGTWSEAGRLLNQNERLKNWPVCCRLPGPEDSAAGQPLQPGEFARCRAPPQEGFVSTLEAIGRVLVALSQAEERGRATGRGAARTQAAAATEGRFGRKEYDALLAPLREMVRLQEGFVAGALAAPEPEPT